MLPPDEWLDPEETVPIGHIVSAAVEIGRSLKEVVGRLRAYGFSVPELPIFREEALPADVLLLSRVPDRGHISHYREDRWLSDGQSVSLGHILAAAQAVGWRPKAVARRLAKYGFDTPEESIIPESVSAHDLHMLGYSSRRLIEPVSILDVAAESERTGRPPVIVAARMRALGLDTPDPMRLPTTFDPADKVILSLQGGTDTFDTSGSIPFDESVPIGHVLNAADYAERTPGEIISRLTAYGLTVEEVPWLTAKWRQLGEVKRKAIKQLLARRHDRTETDLSEKYDIVPPKSPYPWLKSCDRMTLPELVVHVALSEWQVVEATKILTRYGVSVPDIADLPADWGPEDVALIHNYSMTALSPKDVVPVGRIIASAALSGRTPADICDRLRAFGFTIPEAAYSLEVRDEKDADCVCHRKGEELWLDPVKPVPARYLIDIAIASKGRLTPREVAERLLRLGFRLADGVELSSAGNSSHLKIFNGGGYSRDPAKS